MKFSHENPGYSVSLDANHDPTFSLTDNTVDDLRKFLARPVRISSYTINVGTSLSTGFNPWSNFLSTKRVTNRMSNFYLARANLCVKFVLNGTPFHYGRIMASYLPIPDNDLAYPWRLEDIESNSTNLVLLSQRPHLNLDPCNSEGGVMKLPFLWPYNNCNLTESELQTLGYITLQSFASLKHANGATGGITLSVYAWMEDVELNIPTTVNISGITPQSGEIEKDGAISKPLTSIAGIARTLSEAPLIGPYAKATQLLAQGGAMIARLFGFSRPIIPRDIVPYKPVYAGDMASSAISDTSVKLSLDPKQELTVDPRVVGLNNKDELSIKHIATKESFLTQFTWTDAATADTLLFNSRINPNLFTSAGTPSAHYMTALQFVSLPFVYWRGSINFRFQAMCSSFHKGRLRIVFDPSLITNTEMNLAYSVVLDLAENRDVTISIPWAQDRTWCKNSSPLAASQFSTTLIATSNHGVSNGVVGVYVLNELAVPDSVVNNDIIINVFVSGGDDFELAVPSEDRLESLSYFVPQSGALAPLPEEGKPETDVDMNITPDINNVGNAYDVWFGETCVSLRTLLKRYCYYVSYQPANSILTYAKFTVPNFPMLRGFPLTSTNLHNATTPIDPTPYNFTKMTFLNYITPAYLMKRGALRWKYIHESGADNGSSGQLSARNGRYMRIDKNNETSFLGKLEYNAVNIGGTKSTSEVARAVSLLNLSGKSGTNYTPTTYTPVNEVEIPFYDNKRYISARTGDLDSMHFHTLSATFNAGANYDERISSYCAAGEDFNVFGYVGPPRIYSFVDPVPSTSENGVFT